MKPPADIQEEQLEQLSDDRVLEVGVSNISTCRPAVIAATVVVA